MPFPLSRTCARCRVHKPIGEFPLKNAARGTYRSYCRPCCREYGREHYERNRERYLGRIRRRRDIDRPANQRYVDDYLATHPCVDCGEADPVVLEFDHRDPAQKRDHVGRLAHTNSRAVLAAEIAKCDVRCGNCHRRRTLLMFGSYRGSMGRSHA